MNDQDHHASAATEPPATRSMTVTLDRIVRESVEVRVPLSCPKCGLSFEDDGALVEEGYCATNQPCSIGVVDGEPRIDAYEASENIYDLGLVVGYQCGGCGLTIVSTDNPDGVNGGT